MTDDDLKRVSRADVLFAGFHRGAVALAGEVRGPRLRRFAAELNVGELKIGLAALKLPAESIDTSASFVVSGSRIFLIDMRMGDDDDRLVDVIEQDHPIVERELHVRQTPIVLRSVRQMLHISHRVVSA